jgi:hypothetical protein
VSAIFGMMPIAVTAFAGNSIVQVMRGEGGKDALILAAVAGGWLVIGWFARRWLKARETVEARNTDD